MHLSIEPVTSWPRTLLAAMITLLVIVTGETLAHKLSSREPRLAYVPSESLPFNGGGKNVGIYQVDVTNEGDAAADAVTGSMRIPGATIDSERVSGPGALPIDAKAEGDTVHISAPSLNPTEIIRVSILASSSSNLPPQPEVSVRANGVTGIQRLLGSTRRVAPSISSTVIIASAAILLMLLLQIFLRRWRGDSVPETSEQKGWRNVADVFWLGHDLMWTFKQVVGGSPRERILHGLTQSRHHATQIGLATTSAYSKLDSMHSEVNSLADTSVDPQWRTEANKRVTDLIAGFGGLAKLQQPDFEPSPR
jgi:hypothetical protein